MTGSALLQNPKTRPLPRAERDRQILALRAVGTPIQAIADRLAIGEKTVRRVVAARLQELNRQISLDCESLRSQQLLELAGLRQRLAPLLASSEPSHRLGAVRSWLALLERESRLVGLDQPMKIELAAQSAAAQELLQHLADRLPAETMEEIVGALTEP